MHKSLKPKYVLKYSSPSVSSLAWEGALPIGNSRVSALVQGGARKDRIMLTTDASVYGGSVGVLPDVSDKLKEVRRLVGASNQVMAGITFEKALEGKKYTPSVDKPLPIADIVINHTNAGKISSYLKTLALDQAEVSVQYQANGVKIDRSCFVSFKDDLFYLEISKSGASGMDIEISLEAHDKSKLVFDSEVASLPDSEVKEVSSNFLVYEAQRNGKAYGSVIRVAVDNKAVIDVQNDKIRLMGAEKIVVIGKCYVGKVKDKLYEKVRSELGLFKQISYEKAYSAHLDNYLKVWGKAELSLNGNKDCFVPDLNSADSDCKNGQYLEKLFHFAKYLNIVGLNDNFTSPFATGLWNYHYNNEKALLDTSVSLPALYSLCFVFGEPAKVEGLVNYVQKYTDELKKNANRLYKSSGYMVPNSFVMGSMLPARVDAGNISTISAGASIANLYYEYFLYTKDIKFLNNVALPFMMNVLDFYMNYFYINEKGDYKSNPSHAPFGKSKYYESKHVAVHDTPTADFVMAKSVAKYVIEIANVYSLHVPKILEYQKFYNKLKNLILEEDSEIKEFATDENSDRSSGILHLFDVFGTKEVTSLSDNDKLNVYLNSLKTKLSAGLYSQNIVVLARLLEMCVYLGQKDLFVGLLSFVCKNYLSENMMFLSCDKYGLCDGNVGDLYFNMPVNMLVASAIVKAFIQDDEKNIYILPCKPSGYESGAISGIYTRNSTIVDITFDDKRGNAQVSIKAIKSTNFNLVLFKGVKKVKGQVFDANNPIIKDIKLSAGKVIQFDIKY